ncbi:MAG: hypothetical protein EP305_07215 [Bacteroidetes bacterium]|nr:MAG: hypothetical protein EP305_07215 [Bacteroidota bacterium]
MKISKNTYLYFFPVLLILTSGIYISLSFLNILSMPFENALQIGGFTFLIFFLGVLIMAPGFSKGAQQFVMRFMVITTLQMLSVLSVIMVVAYRSIENAKWIGYHLLFLFCFFLFVQSFLLIKAGSGTSDGEKGDSVEN